MLWEVSLMAVIMIAVTMGWGFAIYAVLFDQMRKSFAYILQLTAQFRKKTTYASSMSADILREDEYNKGFRFADENNLETWWKMREHIYATSIKNTQYHNATMEGFIVIIVLNAVALLTQSFVNIADVHFVVYVYLFSLEALLTATIVKRLRDTVRINK